MGEPGKLAGTTNTAESGVDGDSDVATSLSGVGDEHGVLAKLRLWFDLHVDLVVSLSRVSIALSTSALGILPQGSGCAASFDVLEVV
jgi:hypothetical protein